MYYVIKRLFQEVQRRNLIYFSGTQCKEDFVSSPWDTCNKCKCKNGKVTRNCQQTEMQGGLAMMWQMSFYFIGCSGIYSKIYIL